MYIYIYISLSLSLSSVYISTSQYKNRRKYCSFFYIEKKFSAPDNPAQEDDQSG